MQRKTIASIAEMEAFAAERLADFSASFSAAPAISSGATLVLLRGDLGAGKTAFSKAIAKALGVTDEITSPTFVIQKSYVPQGSSANSASGAASAAFKKLVHIDAYRLEKPEELLPLGWKKLLAEQGTLILLEWPERVEAVLPARPSASASEQAVSSPAVREIRFRFVDEGTREVEY